MDGKRLWRQIVRHKVVYAMLIPIAIYFCVFSYYPLILGIVKSFQESKLIGTPEFVWLDNYKAVLVDSRYAQAMVNSLIIGIGTFIVQFILGIVIALCLNELKNKIAKSVIQTFTYLPNLLSWAVVGGMWRAIFASNGMVNGFLQAFHFIGDSPVIFMSELSLTHGIMIFTGAWKGAGYFAVLFLTAIVSIDPAIYEAAMIDGASRVRQIRSITVPALIPTMKVITVLSAMSLLRNFDQVFVMSNSVILDKARTLLLHIYTEGIQKFQIGTATAAATLVLLATMLISFVVRKLIRYDDSYT